MRGKKHRLGIYSFYDYTGIEKHLEKMAKKGWLLEKITSISWTYRRIEPKELRFAVVYDAKASEFDAEPSKEQQSFRESCADKGWVFAAASAQMQIFCSEQENPIPMKTDAALEVEQLHAAAKKSFLPTYLLLLIIGLWELLLFVKRFRKDPLEVLCDSASLSSGFAWLMLLLLCIVEIGGYYFWRHRAVRASKRGELLKTHAPIQRIIFGIVMLELVYWIFTLLTTTSVLMKSVGLLMLVYMVVLLLLVNGIKQFLKRKKYTTAFVRSVTLVSSFVLAFSMMGVIVYCGIHGVFSPKRETYEYQGHEFPIYDDKLSLTIEDLKKVEAVPFNYEKKTKSSLLMELETGWQRPRVGVKTKEIQPELFYSVKKIKAPFLYSFCKKQILAPKEERIENGVYDYVSRYDPVDAALWKAKEAYRLYEGAGYLNHYQLFYEDRMVGITFGFSPTPEQMAVVGEKLGRD